MFALIALFQLISTYQGYLNDGYRSKDPYETLFIADHLYHYHTDLRPLEQFLQKQHTPEVMQLKRWLKMKDLINRGDFDQLNILKQEMGFPDRVELAYRSDCQKPEKFETINYSRIPDGWLRPDQFFHITGNGCFFIRLKPAARYLYLSSEEAIRLYRDQQMKRGKRFKKRSPRSPHIIKVQRDKFVTIKVVMNGTRGGVMIRNRNLREDRSLVQSPYLKNYLNQKIVVLKPEKKYPFLILPERLKRGKPGAQTALIQQVKDPVLKGYLHYLHLGLMNHTELQQKKLKKLYRIFPDQNLVAPEYQRVFGAIRPQLTYPLPGRLNDSRYRYRLIEYGKHQPLGEEIKIWEQLLTSLYYDRDLIRRYCERMVQFPGKLNETLINPQAKKLPEIALLLARNKLGEKKSEEAREIVDQILNHYPAFEPARQLLQRLDGSPAVPGLLKTLSEQIDSSGESRVVLRRKQVTLDHRMNYTIDFQEVFHLSERDQPDHFTEYDIDYIDLEERVTVKDVGIYRDGIWIPVNRYSIVAPYDRADFYSDLKVIQYHLKELIEPGDNFYINYTIKSSSKRNYFKGMFSSIDRFSDPFPVDKMELIIRYPDSRKLYFHTSEQGLLEDQTVKDGLHTLRFSMTELKGVVQERYPVPLLERVPYVVLSTFKTWRDVRRWFNQIIQPVRRLTPRDARKIRKMVQSRKIRKKEDIIRFLYNHLMGEIRYIGIELGVHSYKPYSPEHILEKGYGDCKDRANLFVEMLKLFQIPAEIVLVRTQQFGAIPLKHPAHIYFNHAIIYLPEQKIYLDLTNPEIPYGELPREDLGGVVLHLKPRGKVGKLEMAAQHFTDLEMIYQPDQRNGLEITMIQHYRGVPGQSYREEIERQTPRAFIEPLLHRYFNRPVTLKKIVFIEKGGINRGWQGTVSIPDQINHSYTITPFFKRGDLWEPRLAPRLNREGDIRYYYQFGEKRRIRLKGAVEIEGFSEEHVDNQYFSFTLKQQPDGVLADFQMKVLQIPVEGYTHFKQELRKVDQILRREYRIKWGNTTASSDPQGEKKEH